MAVPMREGHQIPQFLLTKSKTFSISEVNAMKYKECYSDNPRITPLKGAEDCLRNHLQYICSTCGRVICMGPKGARKARCLIPFGSPEQAKLYLTRRTNLVSHSKDNFLPCG